MIQLYYATEDKQVQGIQNLLTQLNLAYTHEVTASPEVRVVLDSKNELVNPSPTDLAQALLQYQTIEDTISPEITTSPTITWSTIGLRLGLGLGLLASGMQLAILFAALMPVAMGWLLSLIVITLLSLVPILNRLVAPLQKFLQTQTGQWLLLVGSSLSLGILWHALAGKAADLPLQFGLLVALSLGLLIFLNLTRHFWTMPYKGLNLLQQPLGGTLLLLIILSLGASYFQSEWAALPYVGLGLLFLLSLLTLHGAGQIIFKRTSTQPIQLTVGYFLPLAATFIGISMLTRTL